MAYSSYTRHLYPIESAAGSELLESQSPLEAARVYRVRKKLREGALIRITDCYGWVRIYRCGPSFVRLFKVERPIGEERVK